MTIDKIRRCKHTCSGSTVEICGGTHVDDRFVTVSEIGKYARNKIHNGHSEYVKQSTIRRRPTQGNNSITGGETHLAP